MNGAEAMAQLPAQHVQKLSIAGRRVPECQLGVIERGAAIKFQEQNVGEHAMGVPVGWIDCEHAPKYARGLIKLVGLHERDGVHDLRAVRRRRRGGPLAGAKSGGGHAIRVITGPGSCSRAESVLRGALPDDARTHGQMV